MVVIQIPVKNHVKKYLQRRYGENHKVSAKTFIGLFLIQLLDHDFQKTEIELNNPAHYEIVVPEYYFNKNGYSLCKKKLKFIGVCLEKLFMEDFYLFVDHELQCESRNAAKSIKKFLFLNNITENEVKYESLYRNYQRYSGENITQKKNTNSKQIA